MIFKHQQKLPGRIFVSRADRGTEFLYAELIAALNFSTPR
jgi:hypothetical protein